MRLEKKSRNFEVWPMFHSLNIISALEGTLKDFYCNVGLRIRLIALILPFIYLFCYLPR